MKSLLDVLLRPLAVLPPGLRLATDDASGAATPALTALGFVVDGDEDAPSDPAAWGMLACAAAAVPERAAALRRRLAEGAWLSVAVRTDATPSALIGWMETAGFVLAQTPEEVAAADGARMLVGVFRRVGPDTVG